jgi:hypothetical protein
VGALVAVTVRLLTAKGKAGLRIKWVDDGRRDPSRVACAREEGCLNWFEVPIDPFMDDTLFDLEILLERHGRAHYNRKDLAELLGVKSGTVTSMVAKGRIPQPSRFDVIGEDRGDHGVWTPAQLVGYLMERMK